MPLDIAVRGKGSEMRARLRPVVEPEHGGNHPVQFVGQMDRSDPAAIGPAGMFELLELHAKGVIELSHGAGEHNVSPPRVLVDDGETVLVGELFDSLDVRRVGPELLVVFVVGQVVLGFVSGGYFADPFLQLFMLAMPQDQSDLQPFARIGLSDRSCSRQWFPLATDERIFWHSSTLLNCWHAPRRSANGSATARSGSRTEFEIFVTLVCQAGIAKRPNQINYATNIR
jgi:hypothetical protein